jgi:YVTN family beta-propeller protein
MIEIIDARPNLAGTDGQTALRLEGEPIGDAGVTEREVIMNSRKVLVRGIIILGIVSLAFLAGCGGGAGQSLNNQAPPPAGVTVSPASATVQPAGVQQFTARVSPRGANQAVTWRVSGAGCTGASCGTIDATGKYTGPTTAPNPATVTVMATSVADSSKAAIAAVNIMIAGNNPIPTMNGLSPSTTAVAGPAFTLTVVGSNFVSSSVVRWNGSVRPTAFVNSTEVTAQIAASDIAATGTANVTVFNPAPGGGSSNSFTFSIGTGVGPFSVAVAADPSGKFGKFTYVANSTSNNVSMYAIKPTTGTLEAIGTIAAGTFPVSVAVDPFGKFAYVANLDSDSVSMYTIDTTTGVLTSIGTIGSAVGPDSVVVHPSGKFAYVANFGDDLLGSAPGSVSMYRINADGGLTSTGTIAEALVGTTSVAVHPSGKFAYVANLGNSNTISMYTIDATTGALTSTGTIAAGAPGSLAVHPSGKFAYVTNAGNSNSISMYTIDATTGTLTSNITIAAGTLPESVAVDPSGKFAYVANAISNDVSMYIIDATTGALTSTGTMAAGTSPYSVAVDPSGKFAYVANHDSSSISMYAIDATTGALTLIGTIGN